MRWSASATGDRQREAIAKTANLRHNNGLSVRRCFNLPDSSGQRILKSVLMIRLARFGARKQPYYRVVVIEKERARNGRPVEVVGTYNPRTNPATFDLKRERIEHWVSKGAQLSDRVRKLLASPAPAAAASVA
jgi:small subunit ribosomal protein S16